MRTALAATILVVLLAMSCAYCASRPAPFPDKHPHIGGPIYRVFDVDEIDSIGEGPSLRALYRIAEACTGQSRAWSPIRVFAVSKIEVRDEGEWSAAYNGMWARDTGWIYLKRGRPAKAAARTLVHEYVHYITQEGHPAADSLLAACNQFINTRGK